MTREEKKDLLKIARQRITDAGNKGKKKRYHVEGEYGDKGWMDYSKGIVDACWAIDELIEDVDRSDD